MGEVFAGRYELIEPIATGGMGTIWTVLDHADGQLRAAKILRQSDAASMLRFVREQSFRIDHTHVVTPLSWAGVDDRVLFTMPLVRGGSASDLLREHGALPVRWVALLTDQLLQALEAVHGAGIVHRDVKPGNLLLEPTGAGEPHLRLTDFGIAAPVDEPRMTRASMAIGTPGYMPPEQYYGADPHPTADLYAVGRVAVELLTGERPAADVLPTTGDDTLRHLRTGEPARDLLVDVVVEAVRADPARRPQTATALREHLVATGLLRLPAAPGESVVVPDRYETVALPVHPAASPTPAVSPAPTPALPTMAGGAGWGLAPPVGEPVVAPVPVPAYAPPAPLRGDRRPSALPGLLLLVIGVLGLAVSAWLLTG